MEYHQPGDRLTPQMTLVEVLTQWRASEAVFKTFQAQAGACSPLPALFDTLEEAAQEYNLDLAKLSG